MRSRKAESIGIAESDCAAAQPRVHTAHNRLGSCNAACGRYRRRHQNGSLGKGAGHPSAELSLGSRGVMNRRTLSERHPSLAAEAIRRIGSGSARKGSVVVSVPRRGTGPGDPRRIAIVVISARAVGIAPRRPTTCNVRARRTRGRSQRAARRTHPASGFAIGHPSRVPAASLPATGIQRGASAR